MNMVWNSFICERLVISNNERPRMMEQSVPVTMNSVFIVNVLRSVRKASCELKKNAKLSNPTHGLPRIPKLTLNFLKASTMPNMGRYVKINIWITAGRASIQSCIFSLT